MSKKLKLSGLLALTAFALPLSFSLPTHAQTASTVMIEAFTSKGEATGTCLSNPDVGGWVLKNCNKTDPLQQFSFDRKIGLTQGAMISQKTAAGVKCIAVLFNPSNPIKVNSIVAKGDCNSTGSSVKWLLNNKQLVLSDATPSTNTKFCLTANASLGTNIRVGDCSQPATLTNWVVKANP
jgi:hypothetical protein